MITGGSFECESVVLLKYEILVALFKCESLAVLKCEMMVGLDAN
jgi:hypothetical protein